MEVKEELFVRTASCAQIFYYLPHKQVVDMHVVSMFPNDDCDVAAFIYGTTHTRNNASSIIRICIWYDVLFYYYMQLGLPDVSTL